MNDLPNTATKRARAGGPYADLNFPPQVETVKDFPYNVHPSQPERAKLLDEVSRTVNGPRNNSYGEAEDNFERIALMWRPFFKARFGLDIDITGADTAVLMALLKIARLAYDMSHKDSWVDLAGYAVTGWQAQVTPHKL